MNKVREVKPTKQEQEVRLIEALRKFQDSMKEINYLWDKEKELCEVMVRCYPFKTCFDEIQADVKVWIEAVESRINLDKYDENGIDLSSAQLLVNSGFGVYCPQTAIERLQTNVRSQFEAEDVQTLLEGPEGNEWYWEAWENVLNSRFTVDGKEFQLYHSEDVWIIEVQ